MNHLMGKGGGQNDFARGAALNQIKLKKRQNSYKNILKGKFNRKLPKLLLSFFLTSIIHLKIEDRD
ncbi:MAG: hypothetical protein CM15mP12_8950 [Gammaproteobacteria bacterium]|nr:MAG: hypothetical protein CM15mP12_8950 [Gammaproteobacteria bacterium]